ncbi:hypothetical protein GALMADRAFT_245579 [Galerina marginata CBS 339.88]|uniref:DUF159-domain-containing protein n=1 Tax=Galerina marginata (strain CBS 339.88) TaxID=685588 RepID=A0A067T5L4_GALM3|nr:hypothetical protein GALMADRAFT_245579 [Galerina marginata CBS 339.88]
MCGRFSLRLNRDEIQQLPGHDLDIEEWVDEEEYIPRFNIAPRTQAPVIRRRDPSPSNAGSANNNSNSALIMQTMKWGLVPHWSKIEDKSLSTTNARSENLVQGGGMWASIKGKNRCAIPCQGYYEWLTKGKDKLPHFLKRKDGKLLLMAGLFDSVVLEGKTLWTFTIVTTDANKEFSWLHERQPVFLSDREALYRWLDTSTQSWTAVLTKMVRPYSDASVPLECYAVPKEVGKVGTESSTFIEPVTARKDGIQAMFSKQRQKSPEKPSPSPTKRKYEPSLSPVTSSAGQEDGSSRSKRLKTDVDEDTKRREHAKVRKESREGTSQNTKSKIKPSPVKKKTVKVCP